MNARYVASKKIPPETVQEMTKAAKKVAEAEFSSIGAVQEKRVEF